MLYDARSEADDGAVSDDWSEGLFVGTAGLDEKDARLLGAAATRMGDCVLVESVDSGEIVWHGGAPVPIVGQRSVQTVGQATQAVWSDLAALADDSEGLLDAVAAKRIAERRSHGRRFTFEGERVVEIDYEPPTDRARYHLWRMRETAGPRAMESMRLKASLVAASEEWRATFDAIPAVVMRLDRDGRIMRINRNARDLAGLSYGELVGRPVGEIADGEPWRVIAEMARKAAQSGIAREPEARGEGGDESTWDIQVSSIEDALLVFARDITQEVRMRNSLRTSETMSAMGALVAGVAHEVRNPLFSISATLDAFDARYGDRGEDFRHITNLRSEVDRLTRFMQDLLDYGRPPAQRLAAAHLNEIVTNAVAQSAEEALKAEVRVRAQLADAMPPVEIDAVQVTQVVRNLIENAIQHSPAGGTVSCATSVIEDGELRVLCSVRDSGPGFRAEDLHRAFDPFFTRRRGGTGLGLAIVQRIMLAHGGTATVENLAEGGAALTITLPVPR